MTRLAGHRRVPPVEPRPESPAERDLEMVVEMVVEQVEVDRARLDAVAARLDALELEVPLGQVEMQEEIDRLEALLESAVTRLAELEAAEPPAPRPRGVIGALRVERPLAGGDTPD